MSKEVVFKGKIFDVERNIVDDSRIDVVRKKPVSVILPILPNGNIILLRHFRYPILNKSVQVFSGGNRIDDKVEDGWIYEIPAGGIEDGEDPKACAIREMEEEAGYTADEKDVRLLKSIYVSPGFTDELMYIYVAKNLRKVEQRLEESEKGKIEVVEKEYVWLTYQQGPIDGKTALAITYYIGTQWHGYPGSCF